MPDIKKIETQLTKKFGNKIFRKASEIPPLQVFPYKVPDLDLDLGGGGLVGRINLIAGPEGSGKTSLAYKWAGEHQKKGIPIFWYDLEKSFDAERAKVFGLNPENVYVFRSDRFVDEESGEVTNIEFTAENTFTLIRDNIRICKEDRDSRALFVLDSLNGNVIESLMDKAATQTMQSNAKQNNQSFAVWQQILASNQSMLIINQLRESMEMYGDSNIMPGGEGQKYWSNHIIWLRDGKKIKDGETPIGMELSYTIKKSKSSPEGAKGMCKFFYDTGFDYYSSLVHTAIRMNILEKSGSWFILPNGDRLQGEEKFVNKLKEDKEFLDNLEKLIYDKMPVRIWNGENA